MQWVLLVLAPPPLYQRGLSPVLHSYVSHEDVEPFLSRFDAIDADGSGRLDRADLEAMIKVRLPDEITCQSGSRVVLCVQVERLAQHLLARLVSPLSPAMRMARFGAIPPACTHPLFPQAKRGGADFTQVAHHHEKSAPSPNTDADFLRGLFPGIKSSEQTKSMV